MEDKDGLDDFFVMPPADPQQVEEMFQRIKEKKETDFIFNPAFPNAFIDKIFEDPEDFVEI